MKARTWRGISLLVVVMQLLPVAMAHHYEDPETGPSVPVPVNAPNSPVPVPENAHVPTQGEIENNTSTGAPLADSVRGMALARANSALESLNATLMEKGVSADVLPASNANVFKDAADPDSRVGGIGAWQVLRDAGWDAKPGVGWNGTSAFTTTNVTKGTYAKQKSVFLSPAIDLSAYPLTTGTLPYSNAGIDVGGTVIPICRQAVGTNATVESVIQTGVPWPSPQACIIASPDGRPLQDQINLIFRHRMNVPDGQDGGQVRVFVEKPDGVSVASDMGDLIVPIQGYGSYSTAQAFQTAAGDAEASFTGSKEWETVVFDLTAYAGRTIWVGFVFGSTRSWDRSAYPDPSTPGGWFVDNVEVRAPALANDLKLWGIDGPNLRLGPGDEYPRVAPGSNITVSPIVLNAAANPTSAHLVVDITFNIEGVAPIHKEFDRNLTPGETWAQPIDLGVPTVEGDVFTVSASVTPTDTTLNNGFVQGYRIAAVREVEFSLEPSAARVDVGDPETVTATVRNAGNLPATVVVKANLTLPRASPQDDPQNVTLEPTTLELGIGETQTVNWNVQTSARGRYEVNANATAGASTLDASTFYFVHASPPAIYANGGAAQVNRTGWTPTLVLPEPPNDEWVWFIDYKSSLGNSEEPALVARPNICAKPVDPTLPAQFPQEVAAELPTQPPTEVSADVPQPPNAEETLDSSCLPDAASRDQKFERLRIFMRYASDIETPKTGTVTVSYALPVTGAGTEATPQTQVPMAETSVWFWRYPVGGATTLLVDESYLAWKTLDTRVLANDSLLIGRDSPGSANSAVNTSDTKGYMDLWSLQGLEVHVHPPFNPGKFYVDELILSGVPAGEDESQRRELIHVTGHGDVNVNGTHPNCLSAFTSGAGLPPIGGVPSDVSCWKPLEPRNRTLWPTLLGVASQADIADANNWNTAQGSSLFVFGSKDGPVPPAQQKKLRGVLLSPEIQLEDAQDPALVLDHSYFTNAFPHSDNYVATPAAAKIQGVHYVELQYLRDDGQWSDFVRIVPEGGYPSVLFDSKITESSTIPPYYDNNNGEVEGGVSADGFYYPAPCSVVPKNLERCDQGGYVRDSGPPGSRLWRNFTSPHAEVSVFKLKNQTGLEDVDFSDRLIRLGFRTPRMSPQPQSEGIGYWLLKSVQVLPFPDFAIDGAVHGFRLETPYDWQAIGVGPGTTVFANVTVQNRGIYPDTFVVTMNVTQSELGDLVGVQVETGILAPGETKSLKVPWNVPADEAVNYTLSASIAPRDPSVQDEFKLNDKLQIGTDGSLVAQSHRDFSMGVTVVPPEGPAGFSRHVFVTLSNLGNVPLADLSVSRSVSRTTSAGTFPAPGGDPAAFHVPLLPLGARDLPLAGLTDASDLGGLQYTPPDLGDYTLHVATTSGDRTLRSAVAFDAIAQLYADTFENGIDWKTDDPAAWTLTPGPDGSRALTATGSSSGIFPPSSDLTIESPPLPLATARSAMLTLLAKYDLEPGYDGARVEVSTPDGSWVPLYPLDSAGLSRAYPGDPLVGSNPLAQASFPANTTALTGDSHDAVANIDGWAPYSFDLGQVPAFQDFVPLEVLTVPHSAAGDLKPLPDVPHAFSASWLQKDAGNPASRWEVRHEGDGDLIMDAWWSGMVANETNGMTLFGAANTPGQFEPTESLYVTWWEHRAGASPTSPQGVGSNYTFILSASVPPPNQPFGGRGSSLQFTLQNASLPAFFNNTTERGGYWSCNSACGKDAILDLLAHPVPPASPKTFTNSSASHGCTIPANCFDMTDTKWYAGDVAAAGKVGALWPMFAGSDVPLSSAEFARGKSLGQILQLPVAAGAVGIAYNASSFPACAGSGIQISADDLATIFSSPNGMTWGALSGNNPCLAGNAIAIKPILRCDASGSTFALTDYLGKIPGSGWTAAPTMGPLPAITGSTTSACGHGDAGAATELAKAAGGIAYLDLNEIQKRGFSSARIETPQGEFVKPTPAAIQNALGNVNLKALPKADESWADVSFVAQACDECYPIVALTYLITYANPQQVVNAPTGTQWNSGFSVNEYLAMRLYLSYLVNGAQDSALPAGYVPLPEDLRDISNAGINMMSWVSAQAGRVLATENDTKVLASQGTWNLVGVKIPPDQLANVAGLPIFVTFIADTPTAIAYPPVSSFDLANRATNTGWLVSDVSIFVKTGLKTVYQTQPDFSLLPTPWKRVCVQPSDDCGGLPARNAPWKVVDEIGPDNLTAPMWKLDLDTPKNSDNVDARVVTPVVDLTKTTGSQIQLDLVHKYDLEFREQLVPRAAKPWVSKWYQGGVVEAQTFDPITGTWGPWKQLFAQGYTPDADLRPVEAAGETGLPYSRMFYDAGQTFQRFSRQYNQTVYAGSLADNYVRPLVGDVSFAFSGTSPADPAVHDFVHDRFDLTPFSGHLVRIAFHGWTGNVNASAERHWTIASATIEGNVLSAGTPKVRIHLATDASDLKGSFAVADVKISGITNSRDVGLQLDEQPTAVRSHGTANVSGVLRNFGPSTRQALALGISATSLSTGQPVPVYLGDQKEVALRPGSRYQQAIELPALSPAGTGNDSAEFSFSVFVGEEGDDVSIKLQALEQLGLDYLPVLDEIAARASREWRLSVFDQAHFVVETPIASPPFLDRPGSVNATVVIRNDGTLPLNLSATFSVLPDGDVLPSQLLPELAPGARIEVAASKPIRALNSGNQRLSVTVTPIDGEQGLTSTAILRVDQTEKVMSQSFEPGEWPDPRWEVLGDFEATKDSEFFGSTVMLFGVNDSEYANGQRADGQLPAKDGTLMLPVMDASELPPHPVLTFWEKSRMTSGHVRVEVVAIEPKTCYGVNLLGGAVPMEIWRAEGSQQTTPTFRQVPLGAIFGCDDIKLVQLRIVVSGVRDQGWRVDGVTISSSRPSIAPSVAAADVGDSARKDYPFEVANPGLSTRTLDFSIDPVASRLSPEQLAWISLSPTTLTIGPGERGIVHVLVTTPPAVGAFPQALTAVVRGIPRDAPFDRVRHTLELDFDPRPRPDLSVQVSVDGKLLVPGLEIEESTPHEITVAIRNTGGAASVPTSVRLEAIDAKTGASVWNDTQPVDRGVLASLGGDDVFIASTHWTPPGNLGPYLVRATVDPLRLLVDFDRSNDDITVPVNVTQLRRPDLDVSPSTATATTPDGQIVYEATPGSFVHVQASVRNVGITDAEGVVIRLIAGSSVLKEEPIGTLAPGESFLIEANHIVPETTVTYKFIAFTPYTEVSLSNNAVSLLLPVFPPDIQIEAVDPIAVTADEPRTITLNVTDTGPYPQLVNLSFASGGALAQVSPATLALQPGQTRTASVTFDVPATASAGRHALVLEGVSATGARTQRTIPIDIEARAAADIRVRSVAQDPRNATIPVEVQNTGNLPMPVALTIRTSEGDIGAIVTENLSVGANAIVQVPLRLPEGTRPGDVPITILATGAGSTLASRSSTLSVKAWGDVDALPAKLEDVASQTYSVGFLASGTHDFVITPRLEGAPWGSKVAFDPPRIQASPGSNATLRFSVTPPAGVAPGLYSASLRLVDQVDASQIRSIPVVLDLRRANLTLHSLQHVSAGLDKGDLQQWHVKARNVGDQVSGAERVDLFVDQVLVATTPIPPLAPGESASITLAWNGTDGKHSVLLAVGTQGGAREPWQVIGDTIQIGSGSIVPGAFNRVPADGAFLSALAAVACVLILRGWRRRGA